MYGTQTQTHGSAARSMFENDVEMYGTQTEKAAIIRLWKFENDVEMYGTQTIGIYVGTPS